MTNKRIYTVAGHSFDLVLQNEVHPSIRARMESPYVPFIEEHPREVLFTVTVCDVLPEAVNSCLVYKDPNPNPLDAKIDIYRTNSGHLFELIPQGGGDRHSMLYLSSDLQRGKLLLKGDDNDRICAFNSGMMLCYMLASVRHHTALMHASAVIAGGKSYLFLGRSGTGKSTHSALWLQHVGGSALLNDDHPIIRLDDKGRAIVYGSPWSGKTPCYRNESAPLGAIVRIKQAPYNQIQTLSPIEAYASLVTSCAGMSWDKDLADGKDCTLQQVIATSPCYTLSCLPNQEAALLCSQVVRKMDE